MSKTTRHHNKTSSQPVITLTPAEEIHHRATHQVNHGEAEVIGLLGLATLIFSTGLLALLPV